MWGVRSPIDVTPGCQLVPLIFDKSFSEYSENCVEVFIAGQGSAARPSSAAEQVGFGGKKKYVSSYEMIRFFFRGTRCPL